MRKNFHFPVKEILTRKSQHSNKYTHIQMYIEIKVDQKLGHIIYIYSNYNIKYIILRIIQYFLSFFMLLRIYILLDISLYEK